MVVCGECGFLALRDRKQRIWIECEEKYREDAKVSEVIWKGQDDVNESAYYPSCFMAVADLLFEINEHQTANNLQAIDDTLLSRDSIKEIIWKERKCDDYYEWKRGFTPKEHREMLDRKWMIEQEDRRDQDARDWQSQESKNNRRWRFAEFIIAIVALGLIVLAAFIERGGQPTINIITQEPPEVVIEKQP